MWKLSFNFPALLPVHILSNDVSSGHRNYRWNQESTQGRTIIHRITIITTTGKCVCSSCAQSHVFLYTCSFSSLSISRAPHTHHLNSGAQTEVLLDNYLEYISCSIDKPASVYTRIKNPVALSQTQGLPLASSSTTIAKLIIHWTMYNEICAYGVSLKKRKRRQRSNQMLWIKKWVFSRNSRHWMKADVKSHFFFFKEWTL